MEEDILFNALSLSGLTDEVLNDSNSTTTATDSDLFVKKPNVVPQPQVYFSLKVFYLNFIYLIYFFLLR